MTVACHNEGLVLVESRLEQWLSGCLVKRKIRTTMCPLILACSYFQLGDFTSQMWLLTLEAN